MSGNSLFVIAVLAVLYIMIERYFVTSSTFFSYYLAFSLFLVGMLLF